MNDDRDELLNRLFDAARTRKADTCALEEHFETRLMARLAELREERGSWSAWAWRLAPWFATVAIIVGLTAFMFDAGRSNDLSAMCNDDDEYQVSSLFIGE